MTVLYDYEGTDSEYGVRIESGLYGRGSDFAYDEHREIHLDGAKQSSSSKNFYGVPDTPPDQETGIAWLDPLSFDLSELYAIGPLGDHFLNEEGWLKELIWDGEGESDFAEHAAEYAATLMGFDKDFYFTPYEELDASDYTNLIDMLCAPQFGVCSPQCPTATFDEEIGKILFTWVEVVDDCYEKPTSTIILLTPWDREKGFPKDIILNQNAAEFLGSSLPHFP